MTRKQLIAISYKVKERRIQRLEKVGLLEDFNNSKYSSIAWFLKSINRYDLYQYAVVAYTHRQPHISILAIAQDRIDIEQIKMLIWAYMKAKMNKNNLKIFKLGVDI